ncbi:hypothetical protein LSTR_LSTR001643 [Laodelphax striatellus]|uniref:WD repeat-containing protein 54 beta-propeller domain-containing protein n=2 Tax=Laodelphax striatellus TaxID=195883 RepID=A0A482XCI1_LAOST|nr:hypothetical protein LSTR_LSTR001643 [Laodelphax striatellus]
MYVKDKILLLSTTASAIPNNLAVNIMKRKKTADCLAVIHQSFINIVPVKDYEMETRNISCTDTQLKNRAVITQVMWCMLGNEHILITTSTIGLQIFDCEGLTCKFSHPCYDGPENKECFARGLTTTGDFLCVGNSAGCIRVFVMLEDGEIAFVDRKLRHREAVTDLASNGNQVVSADESGCVYLWTLTGEELIQWGELPIYEWSCTSVKIWQDLIVTAYGSGHIRLFSANRDTSSVALLVEVGAHARWINSLDIAPDQGLILTVSEDTFAKVWQIKKGEPTIIIHDFSAHIKDSVLVGGKFLNSEGSEFCVSSYDSKIIHCFTKSP